MPTKKFDDVFGSSKESDEELLKFDVPFQIGQMILEARVYKGMTQKELAHRMATKQPGIARAEKGFSVQSLSFLMKMAEALGTYLIPPKFGFVKEIEKAKFVSRAAKTQTFYINAPTINTSMESNYAGSRSYTYQTANVSYSL